jgi:hypothetical protein
MHAGVLLLLLLLLLLGVLPPCWHRQLLQQLVVRSLLQMHRPAGHELL